MDEFDHVALRGYRFAKRGNDHLGGHPAGDLLHDRKNGRRPSSDLLPKARRRTPQRGGNEMTTRMKIYIGVGALLAALFLLSSLVSRLEISRMEKQVGTAK